MSKVNQHQYLFDIWEKKQYVKKRLQESDTILKYIFLLAKMKKKCNKTNRPLYIHLSR